MRTKHLPTPAELKQMQVLCGITNPHDLYIHCLLVEILRNVLEHIPGEITSVLYKSDLCFDFSHIPLKSLQVPFTSPQHVFTLVFYGIQVLQCVPLHAQSALVKKYICNCLY